MGRLSTIGAETSAREQQSFGGSVADEQTIYVEFTRARVKDINLAPGLDFNSTNVITAEKLEGDRSLFGNQLVEAVPLLRGMVDQPAEGDVVLLCDFGGVDYYLGPLNTNNSPTINPDNEATDYIRGIDKSVTIVDDINNLGYRVDVPDTDMNHKGKLSNNNVDYTDRYPDVYSSNKPNVGDFLLEGRYGNSIRLGSKYKDPVIIISSGQVPGRIQENVSDDNIISMTSVGNINDHLVLLDNNVTGEFKYSTDTEENEKHSVYRYQYTGPQIFIQSERITFNTKIDKIIFSSGDSIEMNSLQNINISTPESIIMDSKDIYFGKEALEGGEPIVLGNKLVEVLTEILDLIGGIRDSYQVPVTSTNGPVVSSVPLIQNKLSNLLSQHVYTKVNQSQNEG